MATIEEYKDKVLNIGALPGLKLLPDGCVNAIVTSPPYWGLRNYGVKGQIGQEKTVQSYIKNLVQVFREARRVLRKDGTLWLNMGDAYAGNGGQFGHEKSTLQGSKKSAITFSAPNRKKKSGAGLKPKDLIGLPWMLAFALRADGWYLRSDIVWAKKNCMPESVKDRPTRSHEFIFLLTKSPKYYYDYEAIMEPCIYDVDGTGTAARKARQKNTNKSMPNELHAGIRPGGFKDAEKFDGKHSDKQAGHGGGHAGFNERYRERGHVKPHQGFNDVWDKKSHVEQCTGMRNKRDVWTVAPAQFSEAHFATFPETLIDPCILAGCPEGGIVLDMFMGACTTALVAKKRNRHFIGFEINSEYISIGIERIKKTLGMFSPF